MKKGEDVLVLAHGTYEAVNRALGAYPTSGKLQKLMYMLQRESMIVSGKPLYATPIYADEHGPVLYPVGQAMAEDHPFQGVGLPDNPAVKKLISRLVKRYGGLSEYELTAVCTCDFSWRKARSTVDFPEVNKDLPVIQLAYIHVDAVREKIWRNHK